MNTKERSTAYGIKRCRTLRSMSDSRRCGKAVTDHMPDEDQLYDLAEVFKVFGDSTRIKILYVLFEAELCVCDIAQLLNMTQSAISPAADL